MWDDLSTVYMAAQVLGFDREDPNAIYHLNDAQLEQVKQKLIALKPNIRKMWTSGGDLTSLFQGHEVVAAMGWPLMTNQLKKAGYPIGETIPREHTTGWIDHLMITACLREQRAGVCLHQLHDFCSSTKAVERCDRLHPSEPAGGSTHEQRPAA